MTEHILTTWLLTYAAHGALFTALAAAAERTRWGAVPSRRDAFWTLALVGAIVFHAFNGLRIILVDFWSWATRNQKVLFYVVVALWVLTMLAFTPRHLINVFSH